MSKETSLRPVLVMAAAAHGGGSCGPSEIEAGRAVMFVGLPVLLITLGFMLLFLWLWRKVKPELSREWKPAGFALGAMALMCVLSLAGVPSDGSGRGLSFGVSGIMEWVPFAMMAAGTTYLLFVLVVWRIWLVFWPKTAFGWAFLPPLVLLWWPAPLMGFGLTEGWMDFWTAAWVFPGYCGIVTGPVFLILLIEILVRIRLARRTT
ncbi:MAG TPA: hypothetical protein VM425_08620 [Myxococcota bacterium]|nr:hypothetical protein [Myxococcota bacterium]